MHEHWTQARYMKWLLTSFLPSVSKGLFYFFFSSLRCENHFSTFLWYSSLWGYISISVWEGTTTRSSWTFDLYLWCSHIRKRLLLCLSRSYTENLCPCAFIWLQAAASNFCHSVEGCIRGHVFPAVETKERFRHNMFSIACPPGAFTHFA